MTHAQISPLAKNIVEYLSENNDFMFHPLKRVLSGHSNEEAIAALDELDQHELVELRNFTSLQDVKENEPRTLDIATIEGRIELQ